ncbi:HupE/UreJ family protein [Vibrio sp. WJH972]
MKGLLRGLSVGLVLVSSSSFAHTGHSAHGSFVEGILHPLTGWDHLLAMALIGLFLSEFTFRNASKISGVIMAAIASGYIIGLSWGGASSVEALVTTSILGLPLALVALKKGGTKSVMAIAAVALFSVSHGLVQGAEAQGGAVQFGLGVMLASTLVISLTYAIGRQAVAAKARSVHQ